MNLKQQKEALEKRLRELAMAAKANGDAFTDEQLTEVNEKLAQLEDVKAKIEQATKSADLMAKIANLRPGADGEDPDGDDSTKGVSPGEWFVKRVGQQLIASKGVQGASVSAPEYLPAKANTDTQVRPTGLAPYVTQYDRTIVTAFRRRLVVADLLSSGTLTSANAVTYLVEGVIEGDFATVAEGGAKPQIHFADPTQVTDSLKKIAGFIKFTDEMIEDFGFLVSEINNRGLYQLGLKEEQQLLNGDGTGSNVLGILNRSGLQAETSADKTDNADALFRAMTKIATATGMDADGLMINPLDYQNLRLSKDANGQYFGGGFFAGQYGNGTVMEQPPVWGLPTVVTPAVPVNTAVVGAFRQAATVYRKGGIRIESTNSHATDFTSNLVTTRIEERVALAVRHPSAIVEVTLSDVAPTP